MDRFFPDGRWTDDTDARSSHWAIRDGGRIVAASTLSMHDDVSDVPNAFLFGEAAVYPGRYAYFGRLAVHPDTRRKGYVHDLQAARREHARKEGCRTGLAFSWDVSGAAWLKVLEDSGYKIFGEKRHIYPFGLATALWLGL